MPLNSVPPLYIPTLLSKDIYSAYLEGVEKVATIEKDLQDHITAVQDEVKTIVASFVETFREHEYTQFEDEISSNYFVLPIKGALSKLEPYTSDIAFSMEYISTIFQTINDCSNNYQTMNNIPWNRTKFDETKQSEIEKTLQTNAKNLSALLAEPIKQLTEINSKIDQLKADKKRAEKEIKRLIEKDSLIALQKTTLNSALTKIIVEVDTLDLKYNVINIRSIKLLCEEIIKANPVKDFKNYRKDFVVFNDNPPNGYAANRLELIEEIVNAYERNCSLISESAENEIQDLINNESMFAAEQEPKLSLDPKGQAIAQLKGILTDYLDKRKAKTEHDGTTKQYLHSSFFSIFQKSYQQKKAAVKALQSALNNEPTDLSAHLSTLRNGTLGDTLRTFIKDNQANDIIGLEFNDKFVFGYIEKSLLGGKDKVKTISDFVRLLQQDIGLPEKNQPPM